MKKEEKLRMLDSYMKVNVAPILLEGISTKVFKDDAVILSADISKSLLDGHYEDTEFIPPKWYQRVKEKENSNPNILVIDNITSIAKEEQKKFVEIIKYRKVGVFELPKNCVIIITCEEVNNKIHEDIYSLVAHI